MNIYPSFTNARSFTAYQFSRLRMRGLWDSFLAKLSGRNLTLVTFAEKLRRDNPNRQLLSLKNIRVNEITGTLNRRSDFDDKFRPLGKHMLNRWVNTFISLERDGWSPIVVHKVEGEYYVEDGHHRVSVARFIGMVYIEAVVWEYSTDTPKVKGCPKQQNVEKGSVKAYATQ